MSTIQALDFSIDALRAILWEHDGAQKLVALARLKQAWYTQRQQEFWQNWVRDVFNIDTANRFGLGVWGRILNLPMQITSPADVGKFAWGFGANNANFENGNFANIKANTISLDVEQQRLLIKLRYFQLTSTGTLPETNAFLAKVFADFGKVFVTDNYDMTITYFFERAIPSQLLMIFENYDLLPRPAGVGIIYQVQGRPAFGFGVDNLNFENGNFGA